ncbi:MAG: ankyrin repeat domain-containing protein [Alphaproteobacteria bacterium]|nr:ankyrin repeat domain-containing protein [Alphaproteobacteria bacterium]
MSTDEIRALPARPSKENLRKQAKRRAKADSLGLAEAQRRVAAGYGSKSWAELMRQVDALRGAVKPALSSLGQAAHDGDLETVRRLLREGHPVDGRPGEGGTPLWQACAGDAADEVRLAVVDTLLTAGANPRRDGSGETALHAAAKRGPLALVERLIRGESLEWQVDCKRRTALAVAKRGDAADKAAIVELLDRPVIRDPAFRAAIEAIHSGDIGGLKRLLDREPRLLRDRIVEPECYRQARRQQYFRDPKLFWFVANNPTLVKRMPANMVEVATAMIERAVDQADLDYALMLVMTSATARNQGLQVPLVKCLLKAGASPTTEAIDATLGHCEVAPVLALLETGHPMTAPIAAALGRLDVLPQLLKAASSHDIQRAFGLAAINDRTEAVRLTLDAGADPNQPMPVHTHCFALHQGALHDDVALLDLLLSRGARADLQDKLWGGTPLGWAIHQGKKRARAFLEEHLKGEKPRAAGSGMPGPQ